MKKQNLKKLEKIVEEMELLKDLIEIEVGEREEYFENKSEKWQESDSGSDYEEESENVQGILEVLESCHFELNQLLSDNG